MGQNIVLFIDGTGKNGETDAPGTRTNVWKLRKACIKPSQLQCHLPGVGSARFDPAGKIAGFGTKKRLETAYHFLLKNFTPSDRVYQIYEARVLLNAADRFRRYMTTAFGETRPLPIHFLGAWDTVAEHWSPGRLPDIEKPAFHISYARHAL
jgi:uncharacterized protein (DUF2235 family)